MNRSRIVTAALVLTQFSVVASAQDDMSFGEDEAAEAGSDGQGEMSFGEEEAEEEVELGGEAGGDDGSDLIGSLLEDDGTEDDLGLEGDSDLPAAKEIVEEVYAVQQIYALRKNRLEVAGSFGFTLNDPFVNHPSVGGAVNYWVTNVLAVGGNFNWYQGFESESEVNFHVRRATRLATRPTNYQVGFWGNFTYVPFYGKFAMFNKNIFQWDSYLIAGAGAMRTRPVPVVDPEFRFFDYDYRLGFNAGLGLRIFLSKWLTVFTEVRDYLYLEKLENLDVALGPEREDANTWLEDSSTLVNNVTVQVGLTIFFPFTFDYKLPK
jgi:outer membrane beta-barrel protein